MIGAIAILVVLVLAGPVAVMFGGAIWSALMGSLLTQAAQETDRVSDEG